MNGPARLADFTGVGALVLEQIEGGDTVLTGLWQPDDPEQAYDELHRLYMARERIPFHGPVRTGKKDDASEKSIEVIILEWSNEEHPAALKLQGAMDS